MKFFNKALQQGESYKHLGELFNISNTTFAHRCREYGIAKKISYNPNLGRKKQYPFNEEYFNCIDCYEKAYWLGFLSADGYIDSERGKIEIGLQGQDIEHLEKFSKAVQSKKPIDTSNKIFNGKKYSACRVTLFSKQMIKNLQCFNIINNKSLIFNPPIKELKQEFYLPWITGYFDGDGILSVDQSNRITVGFIGTFETINFIKNFFQIDNIISSEHNSKDTFKICYSGKTGIKILKQIYQTEYSQLYLKRKYDKYLELLK